MLKKQELTKQYDVCKNGCYLYSMDDELDQCPNGRCNEYRYQEGTRQPQQQMTCVSIGAALAELLYDEDSRNAFQYKANVDSTIVGSEANHNESKYTDIFSGKVYQGLYRSGIINNDDICLIMYVDGYQHQHKPNHTLTMIHCIIMNLDPSVR